MFIQCDDCRSSWDESVLEMDQAAHQLVQEEKFRDEAIRSAVLIALVDDNVSEPEIQSLLELSDVLFDRPIDREELGRLCSIARQAGIQANNYVLTVSKRWTMQQRLLALQGMFLAATATADDVSPEKLKMLHSMRDLLELTDQEFEIAIDDALNYDIA
ncbi:hypothetical protein RSSM_06471 [Rhodopirellula sallentina SM41]|uniref:Co-chaperone DjlA N-terminal domain-containing protein n=2 Tax=Rhodopirellula TaxID=265488 RepID=M5TSD8_9BACT|nr:hypothetical protein RSSM_06471 [Rhodopirellula sallentina SM41]